MHAVHPEDLELPPTHVLDITWAVEALVADALA